MFIFTNNTIFNDIKSKSNTIPQLSSIIRSKKKKKAVFIYFSTHPIKVPSLKYSCTVSNVVSVQQKLGLN